LTHMIPGGPVVPDQPDTDFDPSNLAVSSVAGWLQQDAADEHDEAMRAYMHCLETRGRADAAGRALADSKARLSCLMDKVDLDGRRTLGFTLGALTVTALVALDAIPLNWAAQAFGLDAADSWFVTLLMLIASVAAMAGLEITHRDSRWRGSLIAIVCVAYAGLVALRTSFLITVSGASLIAALLQALVLSGISAGLVVLGSVVMARTRPLGLSRARAAVRRAAHTSEASQDALRRADERFGRHLGVLRRMLGRQPVYATPPAGTTHAKWVAALERALRAQFTQP
jgi:hypothetical protein